MHFSQSKYDNGSKLTKIAIVTALHVAVGIALVNNMGHDNFKHISDKIVDVVFIPNKKVETPPPPPPKPAEPTAKKTITEAKKTVTVPPPEVPVQRTDDGPTITAETDPHPVPYEPAEVAPPVVAKPAAEGSAMHTAVLAEGCAKPDYPARAARLGDSGTVNLALLVGADGHVADARIQKSSGSRDLDKAAISALSMCKFKAATKGGVAEQGWAQIAYVWTLEQ